MNESIGKQFIKCFEIKRSDGVNLFFNESNEDIIFNNNLYLAAPIKEKSAKVFTKTFEENKFNSRIIGGLKNTQINKSDILAGLYQHAMLESFFVNLSSENLSEKIFLHRGFIVCIEILDNDEFLFDIKALNEMLDTNICQKYSSNCRAGFGDAKCGVNLTKYYYYGKISQINNERSFVDDSCSLADAYFENGVLVFLDEDVKNFKTKIEFFINKTFEIVLPPALKLKKDMKFLAIPGCDKTIEMCSNRFSNAINFRGEPFVPGFEKLYKI